MASTGAQLLCDHRERQRQEVRELGAIDTDYVFTDATGSPLAPPNLSDTFRRLAKATGLPPVRFHDQRHGAASLKPQLGMDLKSVFERRGHSSIVLTADTYVSILPARVHDVVEAHSGARMSVAA